MLKKIILFLRNLYFKGKEHITSFFVGFNPCIEVENLRNFSSFDYGYLKKRFTIILICVITVVTDAIFKKFYTEFYDSPVQNEDFFTTILMHLPASSEEKAAYTIGSYAITLTYFLNLHLEKWPQARYFMYFTREQPQIILCNGKCKFET